jgi:plasmid stabilization system protein ParE
MRLIYHPEAEAELIAAARFYEQKVSMLGAQFLDAADRGIGIIVEAPERWNLIAEDVRRYLIPRFPFAIYYRVHPGHIHILAFKHHSRHPDYWRHRLSE